MADDLADVIARVEERLADLDAAGVMHEKFATADVSKLLAAAKAGMRAQQRIEALERQLDSQYWAGAKAAWNASQSDHPREAFEAIQRAYTGLPSEAE